MARVIRVRLCTVEVGRIFLLASAYEEGVAALFFEGCREVLGEAFPGADITVGPTLCGEDYAIDVDGVERSYQRWERKYLGESPNHALVRSVLERKCSNLLWLRDAWLRRESERKGE